MNCRSFVVAVIFTGASVAYAFAQGTQDPNEPRPIAAADTMFIDEMTFMEVRDAIRAISAPASKRTDSTTSFSSATAAAIRTA